MYKKKRTAVKCTVSEIDAIEEAMSATKALANTDSHLFEIKAHYELMLTSFRFLFIKLSHVLLNCFFASTHCIALERTGGLNLTVYHVALTMSQLTFRVGI